MQQPQILTQHRWLERLAGEWMESSEAVAAPPSNSTWTETVRSIGGLWVASEGRGMTPDGTPGETVLTLGYDPARDRYVGTWIGSMMTYMWIYEGSLDPTGNVLTLDCEGPDFWNEGKLGRYRDIITFIDDDHRSLTAVVQKEDGSWEKFMETHYWRRK